MRFEGWSGRTKRLSAEATAELEKQVGRAVQVNVVFVLSKIEDQTVSYTLTLDVPHGAVEFAERQAARQNVDMSILFVAFLRDRFGYQYQGAVGSVADDAISPLTQSLSGIVRLHDSDINDRDLIAKALLDKYEAIS